MIHFELRQILVSYVEWYFPKLWSKNYMFVYRMLLKHNKSFSIPCLASNTCLCSCVQHTMFVQYNIAQYTIVQYTIFWLLIHCISLFSISCLASNTRGYDNGVFV